MSDKNKKSGKDKDADKKKDAWSNPDNEVKTFTNKTFKNDTETAQYYHPYPVISQKIEPGHGPDGGKYGLHRGYDPNTGRQFEAGENYERGSGKKPPREDN